MKKQILFIALCVAKLACAERVVVIGDSITGLSENFSSGYAKQMRQALTDVGRSNAFELVCLGGSGQTVLSWRNVVKMSTTTNLTLDVKSIFVKDELDKPADTLIIFLGMNDALQPSISPDQKAEWLERYQVLIDLLKNRTRVGRLLLAQPTMYTENPDTYKNGLMRTLCSWIDEVAASNKCGVIHTHEAYQRFWETGRLHNPDFRMTYDYVHPGQVGHLAIADTFLRALGETQAADSWLAKNKKLLTDDTPGALVYIVNSGSITAKGSATFDIQKISAQLPEGWTLQQTIRGRSFQLTFTKAQNNYAAVTEIPITFEGNAVSCARTVKIFAPWLIKNGFPGQPWNEPASYDNQKNHTPIDDQFAQGTVDFSTWKIYIPNNDVNGGAYPGSIDFSSLENGAHFDFAYAAINVIAPQPGTIKLITRTRVFSGTMHDTVWVNGQEVLRHVFYRNQAVPQERIVSLKAGVNTIWLKSAHQCWQWQSSIHFEDDQLRAADLKYALPGGQK